MVACTIDLSIPIPKAPIKLPASSIIPLPLGLNKLNLCVFGACIGAGAVGAVDAGGSLFFNMDEKLPNLSFALTLSLC